MYLKSNISHGLSLLAWDVIYAAHRSRKPSPSMQPETLLRFLASEGRLPVQGATSGGSVAVNIDDAGRLTIQCGLDVPRELLDAILDALAERVRAYHAEEIDFPTLQHLAKRDTWAVCRDDGQEHPTDIERACGLWLATGGDRGRLSDLLAELGFLAPENLDALEENAKQSIKQGKSLTL